MWGLTAAAVALDNYLAAPVGGLPPVPATARTVAACSLRAGGRTPERIRPRRWVARLDALARYTESASPAVSAQPGSSPQAAR